MEIKFNITSNDQLPLSKDNKEIVERFNHQLRLSKRGQISGPGLSQNMNNANLQETDQNMEVNGQDLPHAQQPSGSDSQGEESIPAVGRKRKIDEMEE